MFCPKCGLQNADDARFCRSCGVNLSNVLAVLDGKMPALLPQSKEDNDLFSSGIRNLVLGFGFIFISILLFTIPGDTFFWLLMMIPGICLLASGISRLVKAGGGKTNAGYQAAAPASVPTSSSNAALPPGQTEYIKPEQPIYRTDDLVKAAFSVTEPTTKHLEINGESETIHLPEK